MNSHASTLCTDLMAKETSKKTHTLYVHGQKHNQQQGFLFHLRERFCTTLLKCLDKGIVWRQSAQSPAHVGIDDLETIDIAGVDPSKTVTTLLAIIIDHTLKRQGTIKSHQLTLPLLRP